jgi:hypothetical protein
MLRHEEPSISSPETCSDEKIYCRSDPGMRGTRGDEIGQSWNGPLTPTIRGRGKKVEYSRMSRGRNGGMHESSTALLTRIGSTPTRLGGSHMSPRKGFGLIMSLKSHRTEGGPTDPH